MNVERPQSAPGWLDLNSEHKTTEQERDDKNAANVNALSAEGHLQLSTAFPTATQLHFAAMEERAANSMGGDNRGHKLSLEELAKHRMRLWCRPVEMVPVPAEDEFESVENAFTECLRYASMQSMNGLSKTEIILLFSYWAQFERSADAGASTIKKALKIPEKLSDAGSNLEVRQSLGGTALLVLLHATMELIEIEHERYVQLVQLAEYLSRLLVRFDAEPADSVMMQLDEERKQEDSPSLLLLDPTDRPLITETLALCNERMRMEQEYMTHLTYSRGYLVQAYQYAQLIARFLIKHHRRLARRHSRRDLEGNPINVDLHI